MNKVILCGNLTRDPEMRYTPSGVPVTSIGIATSEKYNGTEKTEYHNVTVWGHNKDGKEGGAAVACAQYLKKGSKVLVEGKLQTRSWEAQDGQKRKSTEIVVDFGGKIEFLSGTKKKDEVAESSPSAPASPVSEVNPDEIPF